MVVCSTYFSLIPLSHPENSATATVNMPAECTQSTTETARREVKLIDLSVLSLFQPSSSSQNPPMSPPLSPTCPVSVVTRKFGPISIYHEFTPLDSGTTGQTPPSTPPTVSRASTFPREGEHSTAVTLVTRTGTLPVHTDDEGDQANKESGYKSFPAFTTGNESSD